MQKSRFVLTDSGGMQKEAYFFKKPCITLREQTEWVELVENGWNIVVGADIDKILKAVQISLETNFDMKEDVELYGNGNAASLIVETLKKLS
ncbi:UDP-N-acetylglucosamine 2-epimerase [Candidatus Amoebophilus asiaticus]|nr:UDP-N-acetylglucosamine 2-epimerase [Candidatus Amoebophilus asiaticus]